LLIGRFAYWSFCFLVALLFGRFAYWSPFKATKLPTERQLVSLILRYVSLSI
jgi:hypothetical protein